MNVYSDRLRLRLVDTAFQGSRLLGTLIRILLTFKAVVKWKPANSWSRSNRLQWITPTPRVIEQHSRIDARVKATV